jgi:choloylglycine hydrolase
MKIILKTAGIALGLMFFGQITEIDGCTGIRLASEDGSFVNGRTLEFGVFVDTSVAVIPRGYDFVGTTPQGPGLNYKAKYAAVGSIAFSNVSLMDGMNEKGLSVGTFYFPGYAGYTPITAENQSKALSPIEFPNWILTQFATIDEVKKSIGNVVIAPTVVKAWGETPAPFHYVVYDKSGKSLVVEPIDGKLVIYDNPLGVLTNSPTFDWHMTNLRNFINLTPFNVKPLKIDGVELVPFGQGSGMVGLPGDFTPPSRFIRAAIFSITANKSKNSTDAVLQAFHILNQFDIPVGLARAVENGVVYSDCTLITCVKDPQSLKYYFKTYEDQIVKVVDLKKFDLDAKLIKQVNTSGTHIAEDITDTLK